MRLRRVDRPDCSLLEDSAALCALGNRMAYIGWLIQGSSLQRSGAIMRASSLKEFRRHRGHMKLAWWALIYMHIIPSGTKLIHPAFRHGWITGKDKDVESKATLKLMDQYGLREVRLG